MTIKERGRAPADFTEHNLEDEIFDTADLLRENRIRVTGWGDDGDDQPEHEQAPSLDGFQILADGATCGHGMSFEERQETGCTQTIRIPQGMVTHVDGRLWQLAVARESEGSPPTSPAELILRQTRNGVIALGWERSIPPHVIVTAAKLAAAAMAGVQIRTPMRGIARHLGVNYQRFLQVRRIALQVIVENDLCLDYGDEG